MCVFVCGCVRLFVCAFLCLMYMYVYVHVHTSAFVCICLNACVRTHVNVRDFACLFVCSFLTAYQPSWVI